MGIFGCHCSADTTIRMVELRHRPRRSGSTAQCFLSRRFVDWLSAWSKVFQAKGRRWPGLWAGRKVHTALWEEGTGYLDLGDASLSTTHHARGGGQRTSNRVGTLCLPPPPIPTLPSGQQGLDNGPSRMCQAVSQTVPISHLVFTTVIPHVHILWMYRVRLLTAAEPCAPYFTDSRSRSIPSCAVEKTVTL